MKFFNIKKYDDSIEFSTLLGLFNTMTRYLNPAAVEINEEYASILLSNDPNFLQNSLIVETKQNELIGFAGIVKLPLSQDQWNVIYGILPEYLKSTLPGELIDAILNLEIKQNIPELYIQTTGELSAPFDEKLELLGFKPIHYYFFMNLDDFDLFSPPDIPQGIVIHNKEEIEDWESVAFVVNEAFKDSFLWEEVRPKRWRRNLKAFRKNHISEYAMAYENDEIVGFCQSYFNSEQRDIGIINTLSVLPSYHHRRIGSALFASRVESLRDKGCKIINLTVDAKNERALKLYEIFGFHLEKNLTQKTYQLI